MRNAIHKRTLGLNEHQHALLLQATSLLEAELGFRLTAAHTVAAVMQRYIRSCGVAPVKAGTSGKGDSGAEA